MPPERRQVGKEGDSLRPYMKLCMYYMYTYIRIICNIYVYIYIFNIHFSVYSIIT